jgi:diguanylate cyclase (GGDEF)-like protein
MNQDSVADESGRLRALGAFDLMDSAPEAEFEELVELAAAICETPIGMISVLDERRQWFKASTGLVIKETSREIAFCTLAIQQADLFVVEDARSDPRFADNPLVTGEPYINFYAGTPLTTGDGLALGTLCVMDQVPRKLTQLQENALRVLARQVSTRMEIRLQHRALTTAKADLERYRAELEEANDRLRNLAVTDGLTGLRNRRAFEERLTFEFAMARRKRRDLAVVLLDVDDFKKVNDRLGHPAGDSVLRQLAQALRETVRMTDLPVRYGGEEFAVILPESDEYSALLWCRRLQKAMTEVNWEHHPVTVSMGAAGLDDLCVDGSHLVAKADAALYRSKRSGKNCALGSIQEERELAG